MSFFFFFFKNRPSQGLNYYPQVIRRKERKQKDRLRRIQQEAEHIVKEYVDQRELVVCTERETNVTRPVLTCGIGTRKRPQFQLPRVLAVEELHVTHCSKREFPRKSPDKATVMH